MSLVEKLKLETRISNSYKELLNLLNTTPTDQSKITALQQDIEKDYEQLNKLKDTEDSDTLPFHTSTK